MSDVAAAIYCRISLAGTGDFTKTDDQERLCREVARRLAWPVAEVYVDHARSAWQPNRKRPAFDKMLADVAAGKINAIVVYHGDRLLRTHEDLLKLITLARTRGIKLASPGGERDIGNPDDQFILEIEASVAKRESANTSRRRKAQYERWRREGRVRPGGRGGRAFAFATDGVTHVELEAELVRKSMQMILSGSSSGDVARFLNEQGATTPTGRPFTHGTVRKMLARPRYAGLMPDGVSPAAWQPVVDRETFEAVAAILDTRAAGFGYATNARKYLLSGIAVCGSCGRPLQIWQSKGRGAGEYALGYACVREGGCRKVYRSQPLLDAYVQRRVVKRLASGPPGRIPETPGLARELATLTAARAEVELAVSDPSLGGRLRLLLARLDAIDKRIAELRAMAGDDAQHRMIAAHAGVTFEQFLDLPLTVRRSLVAALFEVKVLPASKRGPGFRTEDVRCIAR